jgi:hypothetical protein
MRRQTFLMTAVAAALLTTAAVEAQATTLVALTGNRTLATIDGDTATLLGRVTVTGIDSPLVGIDVRPADGQLYGLTRNGAVVTIDPATGAAAPKSTLTQTVPAGVRAAVDFNPAADRLRIVGRDRTNLRANVDTGDVTVDTDISFAQPNPFGGMTPAVVAVAYSNSVAGAPATLLWDIEDSTDALHLQLPPNDGVISAVGNKLGIVVSIVGFDIETLPNGVNRGWLIKGNVLYQLGLVSGKVMAGRPVAQLAGPVRDLAVLPSIP